MPPLGSGESFALVTGAAWCGAVVVNHDSVQFRPDGQFCSHLEIETASARGYRLRPSVSSDAGRAPCIR